MSRVPFYTRHAINFIVVCVLGRCSQYVCISCMHQRPFRPSFEAPQTTATTAAETVKGQPIVKQLTFMIDAEDRTAWLNKHLFLGVAIASMSKILSHLGLFVASLDVFFIFLWWQQLLSLLLLLQCCWCSSWCCCCVAHTNSQLRCLF